MLSSWVEGPRFTTCTVTAPARTEDTEACSPKSCSVTTTRDPADELGPDEHPAPAVTNETAAKSTTLAALAWPRPPPAGPPVLIIRGTSAASGQP